MALGIQVLAWDKHNNVVGLNQLMGSQPSLFYNWISNDNTDINKQQKTCTNLLPLVVNCLLAKKVESDG